MGRLEDIDGPPYPWWARNPPRDWPDPLPPVTVDDDGPWLDAPEDRPTERPAPSPAEAHAARVRWALPLLAARLRSGVPV